MGDVRLILVGGSAGEPHYEQRLRAEIESSNLKQVIILTGRVEPARVAAMLNATDLFVLTSRSEGWCNALAEALACGCPVLATDVGGNAEIVNASGLGRLIPLDDLTDIPLSICNALEATWDRATIAEVGGRRSWQQVAVECVRVFRELLSK